MPTRLSRFRVMRNRSLSRQLQAPGATQAGQDALPSRTLTPATLPPPGTIWTHHSPMCTPWGRGRDQREPAEGTCAPHRQCWGPVRKTPEASWWVGLVGAGRQPRVQCAPAITQGRWSLQGPALSHLPRPGEAHTPCKPGFTFNLFSQSGSGFWLAPLDCG